MSGDRQHSLLLSPTWQVDEGLFNFVNAWSLMFGPLLAADAAARRNKPALPLLGLWTGQMFLTNGECSTAARIP